MTEEEASTHYSLLLLIKKPRILSGSRKLFPNCATEDTAAHDWLERGKGKSKELLILSFVKTLLKNFSYKGCKQARAKSARLYSVWLMSRDGFIWASCPTLLALGTAQQFCNQLQKQPKSVAIYQTKLFSLISQSLKRTSIILHHLKPSSRFWALQQVTSLDSPVLQFQRSAGEPTPRLELLDFSVQVSHRLLLGKLEPTMFLHCGKDDWEWILPGTRKIA